MNIEDIKNYIDNKSRLIGVDIGSKRVGLSISDENRKIATPLKTINYINGQFYGDYSLEAYDMVVKNGYKPEMVVMGMLSGQEYSEELQNVVNKYGDKFGGVFIWEYFDIQPNALAWISNIQEIFGLTSLNKSNCNIS